MGVAEEKKRQGKLTGRRTAGTMIRIMDKKRATWDYALRLHNTQPDRLPMVKLAEYLKAFADWLGSDAKPVFRGAIKGSAVLKVLVDQESKSKTRLRLVNPSGKEETERSSERLSDLLARDGFGASVIDAEKAVIYQFPRRKAVMDDTPIVVTDDVDVDGRVVRVEGKDDTSHIGLLNPDTGTVYSLHTRNDTLAKEFCQHFRGQVVRVKTRGQWQRTNENGWQPLRSLTALSFEVLDDTPVSVLIQKLRLSPANGWNRLDDPMGEWKKIRGIKA